MVNNNCNYSLNSYVDLTRDNVNAEVVDLTNSPDIEITDLPATLRQTTLEEWDFIQGNSALNDMTPSQIRNHISKPFTPNKWYEVACNSKGRIYVKIPYLDAQASNCLYKWRNKKTGVTLIGATSQKILSRLEGYYNDINHPQSKKFQSNQKFYQDIFASPEDYEFGFIQLRPDQSPRKKEKEAIKHYTNLEDSLHNENKGGNGNTILKKRRSYKALVNSQKIDEMFKKQSRNQQNLFGVPSQTLVNENRENIDPNIIEEEEVPLRRKKTHNDDDEYEVLQVDEGESIAEEPPLVYKKQKT